MENQVPMAGWIATHLALSGAGSNRHELATVLAGERRDRIRPGPV